MRRDKNFFIIARDIGIDKHRLRRFLCHEDDLDFLECVAVMMYIKACENYFSVPHELRRWDWYKFPPCNNEIRQTLHLYMNGKKMLFEALFKKKDSPQYEVRVALSQLISSDKEFSFPVIAGKIGINRKTLLDFLQKEHDVEFSILLKIVEYVETQKAINV